MPSIRTKFSVGLFVIIGLTMVIVVVLWLGMSQYFREARHYVVFFDESVQGLSKDSAVKYRGVGIGRVENISVAPDGHLIQLVLNLDEPLKDREKMVAQIKAVGITGIMFVELERKREGEVILSPHLDFEPKYPVIDTKPSEIKQLLTDIYDIVNTLKRIDFKAISDRIIGTLDAARQTLADAQIKKLSTDTRQLIERLQGAFDPEEWRRFQSNLNETGIRAGQVMAGADQALARVDATVERQDQHLTDIMMDLKATVNQATLMLHNGNILVEETRDRIFAIDREMQQTLRQLESTGSNVNRLIQQLDTQPSLLIFSEPPAPKPIEPIDDDRFN
jgi:phospholipid/cholesterol/gamma-HCH transport system substrate-binding protein